MKSSQALFKTHLCHPNKAGQRRAVSSRKFEGIAIKRNRIQAQQSLLKLGPSHQNPFKASHYRFFPRIYSPPNWKTQFTACPIRSDNRTFQTSHPTRHSQDLPHAEFEERNQIIRLEQSLNPHQFTRQLLKFFSLLRENEVQPNPDSRWDVLKHHFNFHLSVQPSNIPGSGRGVFLHERKVLPGEIVGIYPGTVYLPGDPVFFQSIRNGYLLRRSDGSSVDGNPYGLSRWIYRSVARREAFPEPLCDMSWLEFSQDTDQLQSLLNPLVIGHLINHKPDKLQSNVMYFEYDFPESFPDELRRYIPNCFYNSQNPQTDVIKSILMIATKEICPSQELFSDYCFIGKGVK